MSDQRKLDEAIAAYRKAIELDPKYARAHCNLGNALRKQGKLDEAIAASARPSNSTRRCAVPTTTSASLCTKKKLDEAIAAYRKAIELDPKNAPTNYNLVASLLAAARFSERSKQRDVTTNR